MQQPNKAKGGNARAAKLTAEERKAIASKAALMRWKEHKKKRPIDDALLYDIKEVLETHELSIGSTTRQGRNGLRNSYDIARAIMRVLKK